MSERGNDQTDADGGQNQSGSSKRRLRSGSPPGARAGGGNLTQQIEAQYGGRIGESAAGQRMAALQIRSTSSEKPMPAARAACGSRLAAVIPGSELASRHHIPPWGSIRKSIRL